MARALGLGAAPSPGVHTEILLLEVYPYASVYLGEEGMMGGEAADRIAGFWRALGATPPAEPDHLASVCGLYASLLDAEHDPARSEGVGHPASRARRAFLWEHMAPWVPLFSAKVADVSRRTGPEADPLRRWAGLLLEALEDEVRRDSAGEGATARRVLPLHLRAAVGGDSAGGPALGAAGDGGAFGVEELAAQMVVPVRTGIVLARSDIAAAAYSIGVGVRAGDRRSMLRSLLEQEAAGALTWLAGEAERWRARHAGLVPLLGETAEFWAGRASECSVVLAGAARGAAGVAGGPGAEPFGQSFP